MSSALRTNGFFELDRNIIDTHVADYNGLRRKKINNDSIIELSVRPEEGVLHAASKDEPIKY